MIWNHFNAGNRPTWFVAIVACEIFFQLPFFFFGAYAFLYGEWISESISLTLTIAVLENSVPSYFDRKRMDSNACNHLWSSHCYNPCESAKNYTSNLKSNEKPCPCAGPFAGWILVFQPPSSSQTKAHCNLPSISCRAVAVTDSCHSTAAALLSAKPQTGLSGFWVYAAIFK